MEGKVTVFLEVVWPCSPVVFLLLISRLEACKPCWCGGERLAADGTNTSWFKMFGASIFSLSG